MPISPACLAMVRVADALGHGFAARFHGGCPRAVAEVWAPDHDDDKRYLAALDAQDRRRYLDSPAAQLHAEPRDSGDWIPRLYHLPSWFPAEDMAAWRRSRYGYVTGTGGTVIGIGPGWTLDIWRPSGHIRARLDAEGCAVSYDAVGPVMDDDDFARALGLIRATRDAGATHGPHLDSRPAAR